MFGNRGGIPDDRGADACIAGLSRVKASAERHGVTVCVELLNSKVDHKDYMGDRTPWAVKVMQGVNSPRVKVLYDLYHSVTEGEDTAAILPQIAASLGHVQVADAPGRGEPGTGQIDWNDKLAQLRASGYAGVIGVECHPTKASTAEALEYFVTLCSQPSG